MSKKLIFNPFVKIAGLQALSFGALFIIGGALLAGFFNARFDGVLDLHFAPLKNFNQPLIDQILVWVSLVIVFYPLSLILGAKPIFIDIAGTFALARLPFAFIPLVNATGFLSEFSEKMKSIDMANPVLPISGLEIPLFIGLILVILVFMIWLVILYFNAFKTSTNLKGNRLIYSFISGILVAEILSIYFIRNLFA